MEVRVKMKKISLVNFSSQTIEKYRESSEEKLIINIEDQKGEEEGD